MAIHTSTCTCLDLNSGTCSAFALYTLKDFATVSTQKCWSGLCFALARMQLIPLSILSPPKAFLSFLMVHFLPLHLLPDSPLKIAVPLPHLPSLSNLIYPVHIEIAHPCPKWPTCNFNPNFSPLSPNI